MSRQAPTTWRYRGTRVWLLLVVALVAAACGDDDDTGGAAPTTEAEQGTVSEAPATSTGEAPATTAGEEGTEGGASGDPVLIGVVATLTGPAADIGNDQQAGLELAAEELNAGEGLLGRPIELVVKDDGGDPTKASQVMREVVDQDDVDFIFGPTLSSPALAAAPVASKAGKVEFTTSVAPDLGDPAQFPYVFRMSPVATLQATTFIEYMESLGLSRAGLLAVNNALGSSNVEAFKAGVEGTEIEIAGIEFHESGATDVKPQVTSLRDADADALIVLSTATPDQVAGVKARNAIGWDVPVLGFSTMANPLVAEAVGADGMDQVYAGQQYAKLAGATPDETQAFLDKVRQKRGEDPLTRDAAQVATGYDALQMLAAAVNRAESLESDDVVAELEAEAYDGVKASYEYTSDRHDGEDLDDLVFVVADSFDDGLYEPAPNQ